MIFLASPLLIGIICLGSPMFFRVIYVNEECFIRVTNTDVILTKKKSPHIITEVTLKQLNNLGPLVSLFLAVLVVLPQLSQFGCPASCSYENPPTLLPPMCQEICLSTPPVCKALGSLNSFCLAKPKFLTCELEKKGRSSAPEIKGCGPDSENCGPDSENCGPKVKS